MHEKARNEVKGHTGRTDDLARLGNYVERTYGLSEEEGPPQIVGGSLANFDVEELVEQFTVVAKLRPDVKRPFWTCSMALENETLSRRRWAEVAKTCLGEMGLNPSKHPYLAVLHRKRKRKREDCHLISCRIDLEGKLWLGEWDIRKFASVCQGLERKFGLNQTGGIILSEPLGPMEPRPERSAPAWSVVRSNRWAERLGLGPNDHARMTRDLLDCAENAIDMESFFALATSKEIDIEFVRWPGGPKAGEIKGIKVKQRQAGYFSGLSRMTNRKLSWPKLADMFEEAKRALDDATVVDFDEIDEDDQMQDRNLESPENDGDPDVDASDDFDRPYD